MSRRGRAANDEGRPLRSAPRTTALTGKDRVRPEKPEGPGPAVVSGCPGLDSAKRSSLPAPRVRPSGRSPPGSRKNCHSTFGPPPFSGLARVANADDGRQGSSAEDDAELLRVGGARLAFAERRGRGGDDGDAGIACTALRGCSRGARGRRPRLRRSPAGWRGQGAPREVLADDVTDARPGDVAGGIDPL